MATLIDSYDESNYAGTGEGIDGTSGARTEIGQSFTGVAGSLDSCKFYVRKTGSPTGTAVAVLYAHSGTFGTSSIATGAALGTSDTFDVSTLTTSQALITFNFTGANRYTLVEGTKYVISIQYTTGGDASNYIVVGEDNSSPTHGGNKCRYPVAAAWQANSTSDVIFYVYTSVPGTVTGLSSVTGLSTITL